MSDQPSRHDTPIRLLAFGPAWGMPSMDAASSKAVAWMRFSGLREGVDFMVGDKEDMAQIEAEKTRPSKVIDLDAKD